MTNAVSSTGLSPSTMWRSASARIRSVALSSRQVKAQRIQQKSGAVGHDRVAEMVVDAFVETQTLGPPQCGGEIDAGIEVGNGH